MSRLLAALYGYLQDKEMTREEFVDEVVARGYGDRSTVEKVMCDEADPCVGIVMAAQEILGLTDDEADNLEAAGRQDARVVNCSLQSA